jgi:N-acetylmuramoyl-L-alanine amidase
VKICLDPGHGMANRQQGVYETGAVAAGYTEAAIVMDWANELRALLMAAGHTVVRTRVDHKDPAPIGKRAGIARTFGCEVLLSLHCNSANGRASGTETFYRGAHRKAEAVRLNQAVVTALGTRDRGAKTEGKSQHGRLAVLSFPRAFLIEIGFLDNPAERELMLDPARRRAACVALAKVLTSPDP